jgi:hypothetical protein
MNSATGGNGGAIYYKTPGNLESLDVQNSPFSNLKSSGNGGAFYLYARDIADVDISGTHFHSDQSLDSAGGAVFIHASSGNISKLIFHQFDSDSTVFTSCSSKLNGGALYVYASNKIGDVQLDSVLVANCSTSGGNGGHISLISNGTQTLRQDLSIVNSLFKTTDNSSKAYGNGGAVYYSTRGKLSSVLIQSSAFSGLKSDKSGGAAYLKVNETDKVEVLGTHFEYNTASDTAGAFYLNAQGGSVKNILMAPAETDTTAFSYCNSNSDGGALFVKAAKEIDTVYLDNTHFENCHSTQGNGGHICLISSNTDPSATQGLNMNYSYFSNSDNNVATGGNGGSIFYKSPNSTLTTLNVNSCQFIDLKASNNAGGIYVDAQNIDDITLTDSHFKNVISSDTAGGVFIHASNGNIKKLSVLPLDGSRTDFYGCHSQADGGAIYLEASKEFGTILVDSAMFTKCYASSGNGGHLSLISSSPDPAVSQNIKITHSVFNNAGAGGVTLGNGGAIYCTTTADATSFEVSNSEFNTTMAGENGGSIFLNTDKIQMLSVDSSLFTSSLANQSGGALFITSSKGLLNGNFVDNQFIDCTSEINGGSISIEDKKYDNTVESVEWASNIFRKDYMENIPDTGGAIYCKGIKAISISGDSVFNQIARIQGGFLFLDKVQKSLLDGIYAYYNSVGNQSSGLGEGGVVYMQGDDVSIPGKSTKIYNSTMLFNSAGQTGGCFYFNNIDTVEIGKSDNKNVFVANQTFKSVINNYVGGGVFFIQDAKQFKVDNNSFYINKSGNNGGAGIISNVNVLFVDNNKFLNNQAGTIDQSGVGGAITFIDNLPSGTLSNNFFYQNSSSIEGGALFFFQSASGNFQLLDNTFFKNRTDNYGGAISAYRPLTLIRNLFNRNYLYCENIFESDNKGTALYLNFNGDESEIWNCVFDKNGCDIDSVAGIYYGDGGSIQPENNVTNCTFFNYDNLHRSVFNSNQDIVTVYNSIFNIEGRSGKDGVTYFNDRVDAKYCDLVYSLINDPVNHNYDKPITFGPLWNYYFYPTDTSAIDQGDPSHEFYDHYLPVGYNDSINDLGVSGGPYNVDDPDSFLFFEPADLTAVFDIIVTQTECFTYSFECRGDFVDSCNSFFWFFPDTIIQTTGPVLLDYTFNPDLPINPILTVLGQNANNADSFGYAQYYVNLDLVRINSLSVTPGDNPISVPETPYTFSLAADVFIATNANDITHSWSVYGISGIGDDYEVTTPDSPSSDFIIRHITSANPTIKLEYKITACDGLRVRKDSVEIQIATINWGYPEISFYPDDPDGDIPDTTSAFKIIFNKKMVKAAGGDLGQNDFDSFITFMGNCEELLFEKLITISDAKTEFTLIPTDPESHVIKKLCNGEYKIEVNGDGLVTSSYQLNGTDTIKYYWVTTGILEYTFIPFKNVYPNPFQHYVNVEFSKRNDYYLEITDLTGQVRQTGYYKGINDITLDLKELADGLYILHAYNLGDSEQMLMKINKITH